MRPRFQVGDFVQTRELVGRVIEVRQKEAGAQWYRIEWLRGAKEHDPKENTLAENWLRPADPVTVLSLLGDQE